MKKTLLLPLLAGLFFAAGCGSKQETANTGSSPESTSNARTGTVANIPSDPKEVVQLFLDSMRAGNGARLSSLLSSLAREEIKRKQLEIAPLGSPNALFNVGKAEPEGEGMLVSSTWTEPEQAGQGATKLDVVWELRKESEGWRICGMAVDPMNGDEVQIVDFERLEPEQPEDPQRVASLPNANAGPAYAGAPYAGAPVNNLPPNNFPSNGNVPQNNFPPSSQPNNFGPNSNLPSGNMPAGNYQPSNYSPPASYNGQAPAGNFPPANTPANNGQPSTTGFQPSLPAANYQALPNGGSPQQFGNQNPLPPIVSGNSLGATGGYSLPPAANSQPMGSDSNPIRR